ncbi:SDR family oxidoreductase [Fodinicola feengrottensis]|uniref:SDR family oxidoreductase n=1 Tax=Fodinicola feengrottensis TaxID=435914 RepID=A0ABN2HVM1_9ACTN|nr:SDR family oxidoreductase [Fodinicola feengrottensis]
MTSPLVGKTVLITGAARGIGAATARLAAERGARVALVGLEPDLLTRLAEELGPEHAWYAADVTNQAEMEKMAIDVVRDFGGIDVVVANAGVANNGTVAVNPVDAIVRTIDVNLIGVIRTVKATLPMVTARRGYFTLISSAAAFTVMPGMAAYCASKAGVEQFGNALRFELAYRHVGVGTVHPSWIDTDMVRDQKEDFPTFNETLKKLPWPLNVTTSVDACALAIVDGIERRRRRVYVPRAVGLIEKLRPITLGPIGAAPIMAQARKLVPQIEREMAKLGRSFGRSSAGLGAEPKPATPAASRNGRTRAAAKS